MVFLKVALLAFWTFYAFTMGQTSGDGLNAFGKLVAASFFVAAPALYLLPTYEAWKRGQPNLTSIALVNVLLGWSFVGWVAALIWACSKAKEVQSVAIVEAATTPDVGATKKCQFCAEEVKQEAVKCKHCGSELNAVVAA